MEFYEQYVEDIKNGDITGHKDVIEAALVLASYLLGKNGYDVEKTLEVFKSTPFYHIWHEQLDINMHLIEEHLKELYERYMHLEEIQEQLEREAFRLLLSKYFKPEEIDKILETESEDIEIEEEGKKIDCTDIGNAKRFIKRYSPELRYITDMDKWVQWDGKRWRPLYPPEVENLGVKFIEYELEIVRAMLNAAINKELKEKLQKMEKWYMKSSSAERIRKMIALSRGDKAFKTFSSKFDREKYLINTQNGVLNLKTLELLPHSKDYNMTKITNVPYDKDAKCDNWLSFLKEILVDDDLIEFIQRAIGYTLTGDTGESVVFMMYGSGANGKTTFINAIKDMLGSYAVTTPFNTFTTDNNSHARNDLARLASARFIVASETDEGKKLAEAVVKQFTGGDTITARYLYKEFFEFKPVGKIWLATNHKPIISGTDIAIWRRILLIPFEVTIPPENQIKNFYEHYLKPELPGIFRWAVEGTRMWMEEGLKPPLKVIAATDQYKAEMDVVKQFFDDMVTYEEYAMIEKKILYEKYEEWCKENGYRPLSHRKFSIRVKEKGIGEHRGTGGKRYWLGIRLKDVETQEDIPF